ncbi:HipA domain-containing protein [Stenotrophomonas sp. PS02289]|uniref:HipA domain-containing protein n=1 Tax=Stenotrophomonas sp. PS02289 TaxID=2991422 RepID=UPI00249AA370|nr:HipA domain-containing protein [Stenotrophomonas sp. PS02289]
MLEDGRIKELGVLEQTPSDRYRLHPHGHHPNLLRCPDADFDGFPGIPWYLDDLRPEGFLGRAYAASNTLDLPRDPTTWTLAHLLRAQGEGSAVTTGDLLIGTHAAQLAAAALDAPPDPVEASSRELQYPFMAEAVTRGQCPNLAPGGERPKFTATVYGPGGRYAALIKFARHDTEEQRRWADLLVCEHLALEVLREAGVPAAESSLIHSDSHTSLEVKRFDRSPDTLGRRGFVSLLALSSAFVGDNADWDQAGEQLLALRWISQDTATAMARLHAFGRLIGNTDMHQGNIGFHLVDQGPLSLAPAYDMLPMSLSPSRTGVLRATTSITQVAPQRSGQLAHLQWAAPLAVEFWERAARPGLLRSKALADVAGDNAERVREMGRRFG